MGIEGGSAGTATGATPSVAELMSLIQNAQGMAMTLPQALLDDALVWEIESHRGLDGEIESHRGLDGEIESHRGLDGHAAKLGDCCSSR